MKTREVRIEADGVTLPGDLVVPKGARGIVLFAHGSGSSRKSVRNVQVARRLNEAGLATLLFDLLTPDESESRENVFDIPLLAGRLVKATDWVSEQPELGDLAIGYFGASTGAAAALTAASHVGEKIQAIVSRGGRPDLAAHSLPRVKAPTLLIVGGDDDEVLALNRQVLPRLSEGDLVVVPGATHLFEEPGKLEQVAEEAARWFGRLLSDGRPQ